MEKEKRNWGQVLEGVPMSKYTSFKIGGPCDRMVLPSNLEELSQALRDLRASGEDFMVMGRGTNMLVSDLGIRGTVIRLADNFSQIRVEDDRVIAQSGALLKQVANRALEAGLSGLEFAHGIPGSVGGGVTMNAGAYDGEMVDVVASVKVMTPEGEVKDYRGDQMNFAYRHSAVQDQGLVVLEVSYQLEKKDPRLIKEKMEDYWQRRLNKQPLDKASAGSTFKRPQGYYAGKLIDDAGLRGLAHGGAQVSAKHCGFIVNQGGASCQDVVELIQTVQEVVLAKFGVKLEPEVKVIGEKE
ncbi:MAG: UDP-N-acetylmuramate dehydrogenase [Tissierellia bacterium]|nr:UDP-N-acetylmuramate dehydrogenase [Tissierellia bacterium]